MAKKKSTKKKGFTLYYIDETGKKRQARTKEQEKLARKQRDEKLKETKRRQKEQALQGRINIAKAKMKANPELYKGKIINKATGRIVSRAKNRAMIQQKYRKTHQKKRKRTWSYEAYKEFSLDIIKSANGKAMQALDDLNTAGTYYESVYRKANSEIREILDNMVGAINSDAELEDYYSENYRGEMLPNMLKEIKIYRDKFNRGIMALEDLSKSLRGDELEEVLQIIDDLQVCVEICEQSKTEYQRQIITAGEEEPDQPLNLHLSGM